MATPLSGLTWPSNTVTWAFASTASASGVTDAITDPSQQAAVAAGIQEWAQVSGLHLEQISDPSQANVQVGYGDCSAQGLLGQSSWGYNPTTDQYTSATVLLQDPAITPLAPDASGNLTYSGVSTWLQQLAAHEFGAAVGLAEGSDPDSIMNHMQTNTNRTPDAADVAAIDSLYGAAASTSSPTPASTSSPAPASTSSAAAAAPATVAASTLTLQLSEDQWRGNAQFIVKMDGQQIGGPSAVTALHDNGQTETFNYSGNWSAGTHDVEIDFVNDAYGGSPAKDRNLYVDQVSYNGSNALSSPQPMYSNGAFNVHVGQ